MMSRAQRNRALNTMPQTRALSALLERRRDFTHPRVQLVLASATVFQQGLEPPV